MSITIRNCKDEDEEDWAFDGDRWFGDDEEEDGASNCLPLIAEIDGVRCVITIEAPGWDSDLSDRIANHILNATAVEPAE